MNETATVSLVTSPKNPTAHSLNLWEVSIAKRFDGRPSEKSNGESAGQNHPVIRGNVNAIGKCHFTCHS